jgi:hypothetical protein
MHEQVDVTRPQGRQQTASQHMQRHAYIYTHMHTCIHALTDDKEAGASIDNKKQSAGNTMMGTSRQTDADIRRQQGQQTARADRHRQLGRPGDDEEDGNGAPRFPASAGNKQNHDENKRSGIKNSDTGSTGSAVQQRTGSRAGGDAFAFQQGRQSRSTESSHFSSKFQHLYAQPNTASDGPLKNGRVDMDMELHSTLDVENRGEYGVHADELRDVWQAPTRQGKYDDLGNRITDDYIHSKKLSRNAPAPAPASASGAEHARGNMPRDSRQVRRNIDGGGGKLAAGGSQRAGGGGQSRSVGGYQGSATRSVGGYQGSATRRELVSSSSSGASDGDSEGSVEWARPRLH